MNRRQTSFLALFLVTLLLIHLVSPAAIVSANVTGDDPYEKHTTSNNSTSDNTTLPPSDNPPAKPDNPSSEPSIEPESPLDSNHFYRVDKNTLYVNVQNGQDIESALNAAIYDASAVSTPDNRYTITVPKGSYSISRPIRLYSNITLNLYNVSIQATPSLTNESMMMLGTYEYLSSERCSGYNGFENITVLGGSLTAAAQCIITPIRLSHAKGITFKDFSIGGGGADHLFEVTSLCDFTVDNCTFHDMSPITKQGTGEALQLDLAVHDSIYPFHYQDGTMMKNVLIQNCTFRNVSRGIGSHSQLLNAYHENIRILNNTFQDVQMDCIVALGYYNCEIAGNSINNCGSGILFQSTRDNDSTIFTTTQNGRTPYNGTMRPDTKSIIHNNTINVGYSKFMDRIYGIEVAGRNITKNTRNPVDNGAIPAGNYYIGGVTVENNTITTEGGGIILQDAKNCIFTGNTINYVNRSSNSSAAQAKTYNAIHCAQESTQNSFIGNTITNCQAIGILLQGSSSALNITGNSISNCKKDGIKLAENCSVTGNITKNTISDSGEHSISLYCACVYGSITENQITGSTLSGINIYNSSCVKGDISKNNISKSTVNGINVISKSKINGNINGNTVSDSQKTGIQILSSSSVLGDIADNQVSSSLINGICVGTSSSVNGKIIKNQISDSSKTGIQINKKSTVKKGIYENTITGSALNGIGVFASSKVKGQITKNTINKAKKYGIYIYDKGSVSGDITLNTITNCDTPIVMTPNSSVKVRNNTIQKNKNNIIRILEVGIRIKNLKNTKFTYAKGKTKQISLKWKKIKNATGYSIELSETPDFSKIEKTIHTKAKSCTFKKLKKGKTYYVRICTYKQSKKARIYSSYSKTKKIRVS